MADVKNHNSLFRWLDYQFVNRQQGSHKKPGRTNKVDKKPVTSHKIQLNTVNTVK